MRHRKIAKKFGRSTAHREQLLRSLVVNLILCDRIETTLPKAKQARRDAEKMVTLARKGTLAARRLAASRLHSPKAVQRLFDSVVPELAGRPGGYTRIIKTGQRRGDNAEMALIEWVKEPVVGLEPVAGEPPVVADTGA
ncbi:MAG: 50S ribosomal protein L17 [Lentisphaerae bacterium]|jgi:large subunit ribosomal protein L17|nr:50S ribosomal protein L17 [Lentisphaerota bacterium]